MGELFKEHQEPVSHFADGRLIAPPVNVRSRFADLRFRGLMTDIAMIVAALAILLLLPTGELRGGAAGQVPDQLATQLDERARTEVLAMIEER